ncbi:MAG TPA: RNA polymerase sigma factor SigI [Acidimicrobiales bacterium]|nr:RNA polymerase sigma factor SigI [Acidimicrobiales bacterium]
MPTEQQIRVAWAEHRPYLVDMAYRMLGDIGRSEDVVQEAFHRLSRSDFDAIEDARGWLVVVTSRLCLDLVRSAHNRHEQAVQDPELMERVDGTRLGSADLADPADRVTLDDGVRLALLVVLERLSPAERVAFVLHDIFGVPFETVAETVGRPEATCRQLARRARLKLEAQDAGRRTVVSADEHRVVTDRFIAACASGSFDDLLAVLDPDVTGGVDLHPSLVVHGAERVAANLLRYWGDRASLVSLPFVDHPCLLAFVDRDVAGLIALTVRDDRVTEIHVSCAPPALDFLRRHVLQPL